MTKKGSESFIIEIAIDRHTSLTHES